MEHASLVLRLIDAAESRAIMVGAAWAVVVAAQSLIECIEPVTVIQKRVRLVLVDQRMDLRVDVGSFLAIKFEAAFFVELIDFGI